MKRAPVRHEESATNRVQPARIASDQLAPTALVSIPEAARRTNLGRRQIRRAVSEDALPVYDVGSWPRVCWGDVLAWLDSLRRERSKHH